MMAAAVDSWDLAGSSTTKKLNFLRPVLEVSIWFTSTTLGGCVVSNDRPSRDMQHRRRSTSSNVTRACGTVCGTRACGAQGCAWKHACEMWVSVHVPRWRHGATHSRALAVYSERCRGVRFVFTELAHSCGRTNKGGSQCVCVRMRVCVHPSHGATTRPYVRTYLHVQVPRCLHEIKQAVRTSLWSGWALTLYYRLRLQSTPVVARPGMST